LIRIVGSRQPTTLERYAQSKEKIVLPRLITPTIFLYLWLLLGLLLASGVGIWLLVAGGIWHL